MNKSYQPWTQDQAYLLPPSLRDRLPEDHLTWFIVEVVSHLDLSAIERAIQSKDARGQRPHHPSMMVALLVYAYCTEVYSSRRTERACHEDVAFRVITGNAQPYFTTVNEFRPVHREHFAALFVQVLKLCRRAGLVKLHHVAIDGTKVRANASKHKAMSYRRMLEEERRLSGEVQRLLAEACDPGGDDPPGGGRLEGELARKPTLATPQGKPIDTAQRNFTDPDSSIMRGADGFVQAYNAQLAVDEAHQVILACGVTDQPSDAAHFAPMLERVSANAGSAPEHATGDAGYWNPQVATRAQALGTQAWVATERVYSST